MRNLPEILVAEQAAAGEPNTARGESLSAQIASARTAQARWASLPVRDRLAVIKRFRRQLADQSEAIAASVRSAQRQNVAETLVAELLPLADACRFLEREAAKLLAPTRIGTRGRPAWLFGVRSEVQRAARGVVLVVAPANYPLLLPGVQIVQALTAGNAVLVKPGQDGLAAAAMLRRLLVDAGLDPELLVVLPEATEQVTGAVAGGIDHIVLTGSSTTGRLVYRLAAQHGISCTLELSGCDAVFVLADADLPLAAQAVAFGLRLNGSATCLAPRRLFVDRQVADEFEQHLLDAIRDWPEVPLSETAWKRAARLMAAARRDGARLLAGREVEGRCLEPFLLTNASVEMQLLQEDLFLPLASVVRTADADEAVESSRRCPYALGASVFGGPAAARQVAERLDVGGVVINDMIVPTADPRLPFGGRRASGFGVTRGRDGLLEMTQPKIIATRRLRQLVHLQPLRENDRELFAAYLKLAHGRTIAGRLRGGWRLLRAALSRTRLKTRGTRCSAIGAAAGGNELTHSNSTESRADGNQ